MKVEVVVAGASPAGLMAALASAEGGARTLLVDRSPGQGGPANTLFLGMAARSPIEISGFVLHELKGMRIISPGGYSLTIDAPGYFLDRRSMDRRYLDRARRLGVKVVKAEIGPLGPRQGGKEDGYRILSTPCGDIRASVVIDALGVDSNLSRGAGLRPMRHPEDVAWALEARVRFPGLGQEDRFEYWVGSLAPGWKATFSPGGGDLATLGVFVRGHGRDVGPYLDAFLKVFRRHKEPRYGIMKDMIVENIVSGGDPIATLPGQLVHHGLMVTGGAAGQSGLAYSMRAGQICGQVAAEALRTKDTSSKGLAPYGRIWKQELGMEYRLGRSSLETLRRMKDGDINRLVQGLAGVDLHPAGPLYRKVATSGLAIIKTDPRLAISLVRNILLG